MRKMTSLLGFGGLVAVAAAAGGAVTRRNLAWYRRLDRPPYTPPDAAFGPVWTALYALIAASGWRLWRAAPSRRRDRALALWAAQYGLNFAWTPLFFGLHRPRLALADLALLFAAIGGYAATAARVDRPAAVMMAPYLAWVSFAGVLNAGVARRNPGAGVT